ncbi:hypothetical protein CPB85DRAFT_1456965 [Mucidula mucida]|nr:hypothetical protein CPB85DRAFT_1456965 [Mucidula mucida]
MGDDAQRPKKKRKLSDDAPLTESAHTPPRKHDASYYFGDGNCVILVKDTLFITCSLCPSLSYKIVERRKAPLIPTLSFYLLAMLQPLNKDSRTTEGSSDSNPLFLPFEHVDAFRELLWALYAPPRELAVISRPGSANVGKLMDVARVANKYAYRTLETWALDALAEYIKVRPVGTDAPLLQGSDAEKMSLVKRLIQLAQHCNHRELIIRTTDVFLSNDCDVRSLKGEVYFEVLQRPFLVYDLPTFKKAMLIQADVFLSAPHSRCHWGILLFQRSSPSLNAAKEPVNPSGKRLQQMWAACHTVSYAVVNPADRLSYRCSQAGCDVLAAMAQSIKDKLGDVFSDDIE